MKKFIKYALVAFFTAIFSAGALWGASRVLTPKGEIEKFYDEPKHTIDVLVLGGSHAMAGVSPVQIYEETGITAYNLCTWSQPVWVSYYYLQEGLKTQTPKVVLLDAFTVLYDTSYLTGVDVDLVSDDFAPLLKPSFNSVQMNLARRRCQVTRKTWDEYFNLAKYHGRVNQLSAYDFTAIWQNNASGTKGFGPMYSGEAFPDYQIPTAEGTLPLYAYAEEYLYKIIALAKENDIQLVLFKAPYLLEERDVALLQRIAEIAAEEGVPFWDYCTANTVGFDYNTDMADHGHVNYLGAGKISGDIARRLQEMLPPTALTEELAMAWQTAVDAEMKEENQMYLKMGATFAEEVRRADPRIQPLFILAKQGALYENDTEAWALFDGTDFAPILEEDVTLLVWAAGGTVWVNEQAQQQLAPHGITVETDMHGKVHILQDGNDYSHGRDGINVAVANGNSSEIFHYFSLAREHDFTIYTA